MTASTEPRSGLYWGWALGETEWKSGMDANLLSIGRFSYHLSVKDRNLTAPPGSPAEGDTYIVATTATGAWAGHEDDVTVWDGADWVFGTPREGWKAWVEDEQTGVVYTDGAWASEAAASVDVGAQLHAADAKTTPVDADEFGFTDSESAWALVKTTWADIKSAFKTYYDAVTSTLTNKTLNSSTNYIDADALHTQAVNDSGGTLVIGTAVYIKDSSGLLPTIAKARANSLTTMPAIGLVEEASISDGGAGSIRTSGILTGVNTSAWSAPALLYVSSTTAGALTQTKPSGLGVYAQPIAMVVKQATSGTLYVFQSEAHSTLESDINTATSKTSPVDADELAMADSENGYALVNVTKANLLKSVRNELQHFTRMGV